MAMGDEKRERPWWRHWWGVLVILFLALLGFFLIYFFYNFFRYFQGIKSGELSTAEFSYPGRFTKSERLRQQLTATQPGDIDLVTNEDPQLGEPRAPLTIVEFADFGCPFSREESFIIREFVAKNNRQVRYVYRDFPIDELHPAARVAAEAGECAKELGNFWAFHDKLYQNQDRLNRGDLIGYARQIGLDETRFTACLDGRKYQTEVQGDYEAGVKAGVFGTPTFFVNGKRIEGALPSQAWQEILQALIGQ